MEEAAEEEAGLIAKEEGEDCLYALEPAKKDRSIDASHRHFQHQSMHELTRPRLITALHLDANHTKPTGCFSDLPVL